MPPADLLTSQKMNILLRCCLLFLLVASQISRADESNPMKPEDFVSRYENALATQKWEQGAPLIHQTMRHFETLANSLTHLSL